MNRTGLLIAILIFSAVTEVEAETVTPPYPPDVQKFVERVAMCATAAKEHLALPHKYWACDRLEADKPALLARYRRSPELITALNGRWVMETRRIKVNVLPPNPKH